MNKIWDWFNGKKTTIGAILLFGATFLSEIIIGKWNVTADWLLPAIETLNWFGMELTSVGLGHKMMKPGTNPTN